MILLDYQKGNFAKGDLMHIEYKNGKVQEQCTDLKRAKRDFSEKAAKKLLKLINYIENAVNLSDLTNFPSYNFHDLKGNLEGFYAIDIDGRKSQYRLVVSFNEEDISRVFSEPASIEVIKVEEVSKHYGK